MPGGGRCILWHMGVGAVSKEGEGRCMCRYETSEAGEKSTPSGTLVSLKPHPWIHSTGCITSKGVALARLLEHRHVSMHPIFFFKISVTMRARASSHSNVHSFIYVSDSEHFF